ncbi:MAG: hypothetical protein V3W20_09090 [Candidatus Neomarinimicrobiota bacterium]
MKAYTTQQEESKYYIKYDGIYGEVLRFFEERWYARQWLSSIGKSDIEIHEF